MAVNERSTVVGVFNTRADAERAVDRLHRAGFRDDQIGIAARDAGAASGLTKDFTAITSEALVKAAPDAILVMTKGLDSVGGIDGLVKIPGVAQTPAGMDRRIVSVEDGVLLNYGPRTDQVLKSVVAQLYPDGAA